MLLALFRMRVGPALSKFRFAEGPKLKLERFDFEDIKLMCELLKTKYFKFNEDMQIFKDVRLLDEKGKVLGLYTPTQAKKKAEQLKKDLVLMNENSTPIICKALNFKEEIVTRFYNERVLKNKDEILNKRSKTKRIKLSPNMSATDLKVKVMQVIETIKKQAQVEISMRAPKVELEEKIIQKMETVKSMLGSSAKILKDLNDPDDKVQEGKEGEEQEQEVAEEEDEDDEDEGSSTRRPRTYRILVESSKGEFKNKVDSILKENPEEAIKKFLGRYVDQEDQQMRELNYQIEVAERQIGAIEKVEKPELDEKGEQEERKALARLHYQQQCKQITQNLAEQKLREQLFFKQYRFNQRVKKLLEA